MIETKNKFPTTVGESLTDAIVFVGNSCDFPNTLLRIIQAEFEGISAFRINSFDSDTEHSNLRLLIIDERLIEFLKEHYDWITQRFPHSNLVLAYRNVECAREIFTQQQEHELFADLRFIPSNAPIMGWISMMRLLLEGDYMVPGDLLTRPKSESSPTPSTEPAPHSGQNTSLTPREQEVLQLVANGHRNKNIANHLSVSEHTVKLHIHHIFAKIGVSNRTAATKWYLARNNQPHHAPSRS